MYNLGRVRGRSDTWIGDRTSQERFKGKTWPAGNPTTDTNLKSKANLTETIADKDESYVFNALHAVSGSSRIRLEGVCSAKYRGKYSKSRTFPIYNTRRAVKAAMSALSYDTEICLLHGLL